MIGKVNTAYKSLAVKNKKDHSDASAKQQVQKPSNKKPKPSSPNDVLVIDNRGTTIELTVKTKGRKSGATMVSSGSNAPKIIDEKIPMENIMEGRTNNWSRTLREQNRPVLKQGLQQLAGQIQSLKHSRQDNSDRKEIRTIMESHQSHKYIRHDSRMLDEIPVKQMAKRSSEQMKTVTNSIVPSATTIASSLESIEVTDRGVQCGGIFHPSNDRLSIYNPVRMLGILMQEMEGLVTDKRSSKILTEMEQALLRIPVEPGKLPPDVLEKITLCSKLEASMMQLESTSRELEVASAKLRKDKESLQQQVTKQTIMLEESQQRERDAEHTIKKLKIELNESMASIAEDRRIISVLREENKSMQVSHKLARDLRQELNKQIELAEQRYMEIQYLKLEKDKLIALSSYKDVTLVELRKKLKDLQNHISEQLFSIREAGNEQMSVIQGGVACSSPTSTSSKTSIGPKSCPDLSGISLSEVDCLFSNSAAQMNNGLNDFIDLNDGSEPKIVIDKTQSEFISLPGEETSQTKSFTDLQEEESSQPPVCSNTNNEPAANGDWKLDEFRSVPNLLYKNATDTSEPVKKSNDHRPKSDIRKFSSITDKARLHDDAKLLSNYEDIKKRAVKHCSGDPVSTKEQFEIMFQDIRRQSKLLVQVQSPLHNRPHSDWSDSSLPTISAMSDSNVA